MKKVVLVVRVLMGLPLVVFGLNGFFHFIEQPAPPEEAVAFLEGLASAGYLFPLIAGVQAACGVMLLTGRFVPLALVLFAPILVNIVGFHVSLDPAFDKSALGYALFVFELILAWAYRESFAGVLAANAKSRFD